MTLLPRDGQWRLALVLETLVSACLHQSFNAGDVAQPGGDQQRGATVRHRLVGIGAVAEQHAENT